MELWRQTDRSTPPSQTATTAPGEIRSIQYLRGVAALGVLLFHAAERVGWVFGVGAAGVDVFFVISGFIMWVVTCRKTPPPGQFLVRRAQRIVPLYWLMTLVVAAVALTVPGAFPAMQPTLEAVAKSLLFIPYRDAEGLIAPLIIPGWTLNFEMFFYLLFAVGLMAPARVRPWLVSGALVALVAIRPLGDVQNPLWATYTNPILLEFGAGVWLGKAWSQNRLPGRGVSWAMIAAGLAGFTATALAGVDVEPARILLWGVPAALLVTGAVSLERHGAIANWRPLQALGDASYSVYLIHGLAISAALRILGVLGLSSPPLLFGCAVVMGVAAGLAAYQLFERPMMRVFKTGLGAHRPPSRAPLTTGVAPAPDA